jgi:antirestriction protein ArdC
MPSAYEIVTARLVAQLETGIIPWKQPWKNTARGAHLPCNFATGRSYRGINCAMLLCSGFDTPQWMTYKQAAAIGAQVRKGSHGTPVVYWQFDEREDSKKKSAWCKYSTVFNLAQIDGIQPEIPFDVPAFDGIAAAQAVADKYMGGASHPRLRHGGSKAAYLPSDDTVYMPEPGSFVSAEMYYATLFHEFGHSTGSASRLGRDLSGKFGTPAYSQEELCAEFTAAFLAAESGISPDSTDAHNAAYIASWLRVLKADSRVAVMAAQRAQKAADFILQRSAAAVTSEEVAA